MEDLPTPHGSISLSAYLHFSLPSLPVCTSLSIRVVSPLILWVLVFTSSFTLIWVLFAHPYNEKRVLIFLVFSWSCTWWIWDLLDESFCLCICFFVVGKSFCSFSGISRSKADHICSLATPGVIFLEGECRKYVGMPWDLIGGVYSWYCTGYDNLLAEFKVWLLIERKVSCLI